MALSFNNEASFTISVTGENTGINYTGIFKCKTRLSHRDYLTLDRLRREYLGANPESAGARAATTAHIFAELGVRILSGPSWWNDSNGGIELSDDNIIKDLYDKVLEQEKLVAEELKKKAESAKEELKGTKVE